MAKEIKLQNEELALKSFIVLSRAHRAVADRVEEDIRRYGLNPTEFAVLELLFHKGDQAIQQIGKRVLLASGSITYVVDKLEKKSLIVRKSCPKDRRVTYAAITEQGMELMRKIFPSHKKAIENIFSSLDQGERETLINLLKKLGTNA
ncbi:MarR family winged helix-turn-helix transcriptional regulator [Alkalihalobacterium elongatum]|uniref:MarR family winged helix-turn-helix transcriptional regulator n=1 Tax=Alkalihalobacterium elongatum TaxID=2675466 RepID=UPI002E2E33C1|nr:MarR family transcriptional regulator [Alkalihalobacterium elongatum]